LFVYSARLVAVIERPEATPARPAARQRHSLIPETHKP